MATYTSTQNGNWNNPATWGGGGWPQAAGDVVNLGHTVTYNVVSTVELGQININNGGLLSFSAAMSTKLTLGHQDLVINSGGELRVGAAGAIIPKQYLAELIWNTTADNAKGINQQNGGKVSIFGDPDFYGSADSTTLAADWTSGKTFTVVGDFTTKWATGAILYVHKGNNYSNYQTDINHAGTPFTIASLALNGANTNITINEPAPGATFKAGGQVVNAGRNVLLYKLAASTNIGNYNSNRPRILGRNNVDSPSYLNLNDAIITGFYGLDCSNLTYQPQLNRVAIRNGQYGGLYGYNWALNNALIISCYYGFYSFIAFDTPMTGKILACNSGLYGVSKLTVDGAIYSCNIAVAYGTKAIFSGAIYASQYGLQGVNEPVKVTGRLGVSPGGLEMLNVYDIKLSETMSIQLINAKIPGGGLAIAGRNSLYYGSRVACEHYQQVTNTHYTFDCFGDLIKVVADGGGSPPRPNRRNGGAADVVEVVPLSNCSSTGYLEILRSGLVRIWAQAGVSQTYRFYVQTTFATLTSAKLKLYGEYLDEASGGHLALVASTQDIATRTAENDWTQYVQVTINPAQDGYINLYLRLMGYEAGAKVWVDPQPEGLTVTPRWSYGEVVLEPAGTAGYPSNLGLVPLGVKQVAI